MFMIFSYRCIKRGKITDFILNIEIYR